MNLLTCLGRAFIYVLPLLSAAEANSQINSAGFFQNVSGEYYLGNQWNLWCQMQVRSQKVFSDFYYHEWDAGINYRFYKNGSVLLGTGQYDTYSLGGNFKLPVAANELRLWEQLVLTNNFLRVKIEHRYRIEQRWINGHYRDRFRYRLNSTIPLNKKTLEKDAIFASVFDEVYLTDKATYFERNRVFAGLGYIVRHSFILQMGWLHQFDYSTGNPGSTRDFLQTSLLFRFHQPPVAHEPNSGTAD